MVVHSPQAILPNIFGFNFTPLRPQDFAEMSRHFWVREGGVCLAQ